MPTKNEDTEEIVRTLERRVNANLISVRKMKDANPGFRVEYRPDLPASVLNAYRNGDIAFEDALDKLAQASVKKYLSDLVQVYVVFSLNPEENRIEELIEVYVTEKAANLHVSYLQGRTPLRYKGMEFGVQTIRLNESFIGNPK